MVDSFQTGSGQVGSSQLCRDSPESTFMGQYGKMSCGNIWQNVATCAHLKQTNYYKMLWICGPSVKTPFVPTLVPTPSGSR